MYDNTLINILSIISKLMEQEDQMDFQSFESESELQLEELIPNGDDSDDDHDQDQDEDQDYEDYNGSEDSEPDHQISIKITPIKDLKIPQYFSNFYQKHSQINPLKYFKMPPSKTVPKSVCAKIIDNGELTIQCADCGMDGSCIICMDCFKNGNHEGHKYVVKKAYGGCCDCGDIEAWKEEGFCKKHTGQFEDFKISEDALSKFYQITDGLFFYYFYCRINNRKDSTSFTKILLNFLTELNSSNLYYNKMTALALTRQLPPPYMMNETLNNRSILKNLFDFQINGEIFHDWWNFFMTLFSYYPFKMDVLTIYIQNYQLLMTGDKKSKNCCTSLTCQLLTSYKLVTQYCQSNTLPLAANCQTPKKTGKLWDFYIILMHDLKLMNKLTGDAPLAYWRMQINNGLDNIFNYQQVIWKKLPKNPIDVLTINLTKFIHFCQIQYTLIEVFIGMLDVIEPEPYLLNKLINYLIKKCLKSSEKRAALPTLRPYERCLTLALFKYFKFDVSIINPESVSRLLNNLPGISQQSFEIVCSRVVKDIQQTYFMYSKCMGESGFAQSLYGFLYFYRNKSTLICYTDIICLRMFYLFLGTSRFVSFRELLEFDSFQKIPKDNAQLYEQQLNKKRGSFNSILNQFSYLLYSRIPQIFLAYGIQGEKCSLYEQQISELLQNIFAEKKGKLSYSEYKMFKASIFNNHNRTFDKWIKQHTSFSKSKKQFEINSFDKDLSLGISFSCIWVNLPVDHKFINPEKLVSLVPQVNNSVWTYVFSQQTMMSLMEILMKIYDESTLKTAGISTLQQLFSFYYVGNNLDIPSFKSLKQKVIDNNQDMLPPQIGKLYGFLCSSPSKDKQQDKEKIKALKAKKLQKMKNKQIEFMKNMAADDNTECIQSTAVNDKQCCYICKNQNSEHFVYLSMVVPRDHEKLMKSGPGFQCMSFSSCYHVFDLKCVQKKFNDSNMVNSMSCPLCKTQANILMPYTTKNQALVEQFIHRITQITFTLKQSANLYEEMVKTFYHFAILSSIDLKNCLQKRSKIYRLLFYILKDQIPQSEVKQLYEKFRKGLINRKFDETTQKEDKQELTAAQFFRQLLLNQGAEPIQMTKSELIKQRSKQQPKGMIKKKSQKEVESSYLLIFQLNWLFKKLGIQEVHDSSIPQFLKIALEVLEQEKIIDIPEEMSEETKDTTKLLIELPQRYTSIGFIKNCQQCKEISSDLFICLLCGWVGCQNCQNGYIPEHLYKNHGKSGAFMQISTSLAIYYANGKTVHAGMMYQNQWEERINIEKDWNQFELNMSLYNSIEKNLRLDEIPSKQRN